MCQVAYLLCQVAYLCRSLSQKLNPKHEKFGPFLRIEVIISRLSYTSRVSSGAPSIAPEQVTPSPWPVGIKGNRVGGVGVYEVSFSTKP